MGANIISKNLLGKESENLTETEKRTVSELIQVAAGLASGLSSSGGNSLPTAQAMKTGADRTTEIAIPVSAPFAVSDLISPDMMEVLFKLGGN